MTLSIEDPEAYRLAEAIADATGETVSEAIRQALRDRMARIQHCREKASVAELLAIADRAAAHVTRPYQPHGDVLHDEEGLPR